MIVLDFDTWSVSFGLQFIPGIMLGIMHARTSEKEKLEEKMNAIISARPERRDITLIIALIIIHLTIVVLWEKRSS